MRKTLPGVLLFVLVARPIAAQPPAPVTIEDLLQRAAVYVADFDKRFANIVAEERYEQTLMRTDPRFRQHVQRTLVSDFLLAKVPGEDRLVPFRDVFEVDGKPVRNREDRLTKLFLQPASTAIEQATAIMAESARYNVGPERNVNVPVLALMILRAPNLPRFAFGHAS